MHLIEHVSQHPDKQHKFTLLQHWYRLRLQGYSSGLCVEPKQLSEDLGPFLASCSPAGQ